MMEEGVEAETDRVRQLEAMVQKLKKENKDLLTKVDQPTSNDGGKESDDDIFSHHIDSDSVEEDEW